MSSVNSGGVTQIFSKSSLQHPEQFQSLKLTQNKIVTHAQTEKEKTKEFSEKNNSSQNSINSNPEITFQTISPTEFLKSIYSNADINDSSNLLTIIAKWDEWAFRILQWDPKCQCFRQLSKDIGLHINNKGLFTIGTKYDSRSWTDTNKLNCSNFNGFWWQEWNTWWRTRSYLGVSNQEIGKNKLTKANCYKNPVVVIEKEDEIPYFASASKETNLTQNSKRITSRNIYWDDKAKTFVGQRDWREGNDLYFIENYGDYSKFLGIDLNKQVK